MRRLEVVHDGVSLLEGWPESIRRQIRNDLADDKLETVLRLQRFGRLRTPDGPLGLALNSALNVALHRNFRLVVLRDSGFITTDILRQKAAQRPGLIDQLRQCSKLRSRVVDGIEIWPAEAIEQVRSARREFLPARKVAKILGCSTEAVARMADFEMLDWSDCRVANAVWGDRPISLDSVDRFRGEIERVAPVANAPSSAMSLAEALSAYPGPYKPYAECLWSAIGGTLQLYRPRQSAGIRDLLVVDHQLRRVVRASWRDFSVPKRFPERISEFEAREMLNCGRRAFHRLVEANVFAQSRRYNGETYNRQDVIRFGRKFISGHEIAALEEKSTDICRWYVESLPEASPTPDFYPRKAAHRARRIRVEMNTPYASRRTFLFDVR